MDIQLFINEVGRKFNTELALNEQFACSLLVDDVLVNFQYQKYDQTLLIYGLVSYAEEGFNQAQLERALEANLFGYESLTFHLGYYKAMHALVLSAMKKEDELSDVEEFAKLVLVFAEQIKKWEQEINALADSENKTPSTLAETEEITMNINNFLRV